MVGIEFNLISCEFDERLMVGFVSIEVREHLFVIESISCIELMNWLSIDCELCMYVCVDGEGGQAIEGDRGKQPETSNK